MKTCLLLLGLFLLPAIGNAQVIGNTQEVYHPCDCLPQSAPRRVPRHARMAQVTIISGAAADAFTTMYNAPYGNLYEVNPLMRNRDGSANGVRVVGIKAGWTVLNVVIVQKWARAGHPKLASTLGYIVGGFDWGVAIHNARLPRIWRRDGRER